MVFLDSQILSGIYFYHWHLINCKILHLITILSTEFFAIFQYMLKTGNNEKYVVVVVVNFISNSQIQL